ncbi:sarcosine oxidase subunit gamma [Mesorhizobium sp. M0621]|uniref:sarcosine oxidase subunit gamma family protein n=1 Tax=Mesorhizobium sp. M0621 TaxID=2956974 RepID=UPI0033388858
MSEFRVTLRSALGAEQPIVYGGIDLKVLPEGHLIHVLGKPGASAIEARLASLSDESPAAVRVAGPGQWFVVGNSAKTHAEFTALDDTLQPYAFAVDQSHGRVRIAIAGSQAASVLAKGSAANFASHVFPIGRNTTTLIGRIAVHITRTSEDGFELIVLRSFAESLWGELTRMSAEYR